MLPNKEKIERIVKELQKIMRIQDWDIEIKMLTAKEMDKETGDYENLGEAYRNLRYKYACIRLNTQDEEMDKEWYHTLLHELKHIQTTEFIYTFRKILDHIEMAEPIKKIFEEQTTDFYEQWMNVSAREFETLYPITNFIKEGE